MPSRSFGRSSVGPKVVVVETADSDSALPNVRNDRGFAIVSTNAHAYKLQLHMYMYVLNFGTRDLVEVEVLHSSPPTLVPIRKCEPGNRPRL